VTTVRRQQPVVREVGASLTEAPSTATPELRFHRHRSGNVSVSGDGLTASLTCAQQDVYPAAVVTSSRALHDNELFEFRVDRVIDTLASTMEVGTFSAVI